jgi:hypothetical protein
MRTAKPWQDYLSGDLKGNCYGVRPGVEWRHSPPEGLLARCHDQVELGLQPGAMFGRQSSAVGLPKSQSLVAQ